MIIRDLEVLEVVAEVNQVEGGFYYPPYNTSSATASANGVAYGPYSYTSNYSETNTLTAPGIAAGSSYSSSYSYTRGW